MAELLSILMSFWALAVALFGLVLMAREFEPRRRQEWVALGLCGPAFAWLAYLAGADLLGRLESRVGPVLSSAGLGL